MSELVKNHNQFWVSNCGCREERKGCDCSRLDVCLFFNPDMGGTGTDFREVDREFAEGILREAELKRLVPRLFRKKNIPDEVQGICFCCFDCCSYFQDSTQVCDKGELIETTDREACIACGTCEGICHFGARKIVGCELIVNRSLCYGCGLCQDVCPMHCIRMIPRSREKK